jgi:hypothetical protein
MRKFLTISFITLALVTGAVSVAHVVHAQTTNAAAAGTPITLSALPDTGGIMSGVMIFIMGLFAWLVGVAAMTLDNAVYYTVVTMGAYVKNLAAIGVTWRILRDISNIALIFGFLAIGISIILNTEKFGWGTKMLPMLLVAAVFLNFSLFISEAVIDAGNLFATEFYTQINGGVPAGAENFDSISTVANAANNGISAKIMSQLGLATIYGQTLTDTAALKPVSTTFIGFMSIILFLVTAFVMFSLAFILIARFIALIFLIIVAPIGFAGLAIPMLSGTAKKWWSELFEQTITAPILLLMLYIALAVITDAHFLAFGPIGTNGWAGFIPNGTTTNYTGFASLMLSFIVAMGLLLAVVMYAKKLGAAGAGWATKSAGRVTGGLTFGAISLAGRGTLGLGGRALNNKRMQARAAGGGLGGTFAKLGAFTGRNLEKRTFGVRNVPGVRTAGSAMGSIQGNDFGTVFAGKTTVTAKQAVDKTIEGYKYVKPFSGDWWRAQKQEYQKAAAEQERKSTLAGATVPPGLAAIAAQKELKEMSVDELAQLTDIRGGIDRLVFNLSPEKFNELMKSDKLLTGEKAKLKATWNTQFTAASAATTMGRFNTEEIASLGGGTLTLGPVIDTLGATEFDAIRRKGTLDRTQRHDIHAHMMAAPLGSALQIAVTDYFAVANDPGGNRKRYWDV